MDIDSGGYVETSHQSGVSRLFNSIIGAVCVAPLVLLLVVFMVGYNEKRAVCESRAIRAGANNVNMADCGTSDATSGKLVLFQCEVKEATVDITGVSLGPFSNEIDHDKQKAYKSTGFKVVVEMLQCKENQRSESTKDKIGGGKTTRTIYTYDTVWSSTAIDSSKFNSEAKKDASSGFDKECGKENPKAEDWEVKGSTTYAETAKLGAYTVPKSYVSAIPLFKQAIKDGPDEWDDKDCEGKFHFCTNDKYVSKQGLPKSKIGSMRVSFYKTDWDSPMMTALGYNEGGNVGTWTAPSSWMCHNEQLGGLKAGLISKDDFFKELQATSTVVTWLLRIGGFCLAWCAFSMMLAPLGVVADCIPCVGPCLGDMVEAISCVVAICPACACTMLVAGVCWVFMRPELGVPLMLASVVVFGVMVYLRMQKSARNVPLVGGVERY